MTIDIRTLCDALGAEVIGADLTRPLAMDEAKAMDEAFLEHHLLCFRTQPLEPANFLQVARYFGEPQEQLLRHQRHGETPEVSVLESTYKSVADKPDDLETVRLAGWHTDDSYFEVPAKATMLQSIEIPSFGGQTKFSNMRKAYEDFPELRKAEVDMLETVHGYDTKRASGRPKSRTYEEKIETPDVIHPLIRTHEETGRKSFYFNANRTDRIVGWEREESDVLLDEVYKHITLPEYQYIHEWQVGDLLLWDNRCLVHSVNVDYPVGEQRLHQRILLKGTRPV